MKPILFLFLLALARKTIGRTVRDDAGDVAGRVFALVSDILDKAKDGLTISQLEEEAKQVEALSNKLPEKVSDGAVKKLVKEISETIGVNPAASLILEDKLTSDITLINDYLRLWNKLVEKAGDNQTSDKSLDNSLKVAAIGSISEIIQRLLKELDESISSLKKMDSTNSELQNKEGIIIYEKDEEKDIGKRDNNTTLQRNRKCFCLLLCFSCG
ncbi:hypothetical protein BgiBS90_023360 [Biomphalaria glabrata]|uniref:Uncharacterized protein n=1 Tax=Biomphalaria glabrata TaxID=6526 RepID=A0A2C9LLI3_BIOGL|nr:hypothetical protein BgiBS90_023360 [Biomphalaria glabrata]